MSRHTTILTAQTLVALLALNGCQTVEQLAPPVGEPTLQAAAMMDIPAANLERGRSIYTVQCSQCHRPEAVTRYSDAQWRKTLPRMSAAAELNPQDAADVLDYVTVTLRAMALPAAPESP